MLQKQVFCISAGEQEVWKEFVAQLLTSCDGRLIHFPPKNIHFPPHKNTFSTPPKKHFPPKRIHFPPKHTSRCWLVHSQETDIYFHFLRTDVWLDVATPRRLGLGNGIHSNEQQDNHLWDDCLRVGRGHRGRQRSPGCPHPGRQHSNPLTEGQLVEVHPAVFKNIARMQHLQSWAGPPSWSSAIIWQIETMIFKVL